ncbi:unnamed protein product [Hydatigera taeniaeformis]|uniref:Peptidase_M14 domain-containing protein n=1 Tax=Hydatigena taeniaeformis TaxID=6205 RepID=A0A0R3X0V3_HYDTA|nr:unnamed protein product [Hydatigera taeniaeformis]
MQAGVLLFSANFDSGNLGQVESVQESIEFTGPQSGKTQTPSWADRVVAINGADKRPLLCSKPDYHVKCWTYLDAHGTPFENGNKSWFHFSVRNYAPGSLIRISIMNVNHQSKVFNQGYTPVFNVMNSATDNPCWMRITEEPVFEAIDGQFAVTFAHRFTQQSGSVTYFAFSYPWTYLDTQLQLRRLEDIFSSASPNLKNIQVTQDPTKDTPSIYLHRELLCYSLCGRRIDLLTISDNTNKLPDLEDRFDPLLFPEKSTPRPHKFSKKKVFLITARVHPGETPGSHMFNGVLEFLLREKDERAIQLRRIYVFKLIPMLNPDGVAMGHHRTDSRGANLNRFYLQPNFLLYPSVYAVKALATYHHLCYASVARYPGRLPSWQFERFVDLAARYRSFVDSVDVAPYTGNLVRPPFVLKRKGSLNTPMDTEISQQNEEVEDAETSSILMMAAKECVRKVEDRKESSPDTWCASDSSKRCQPMLHVQAIIRRGKGSPESSDKRRCDVIKEVSRSVQEYHQVSNQLSKDSQSGMENRHSADVGCLPRPVQLAECHRESHSSSNPQKEKSSNPTNSTDYENEVDNRIRKLDRAYINMVARNLQRDGQDAEVKEAFLEYCTGAHLTHPSLLSIGPEESGVKCYIDLHGHCTKRGCFCYGNHLKDTRQMADIVLYARLVAANSAFFDFSACNFSLRNMYLRDKVNDTTKEGSGRVGIWKHTGITHCYTVEANYTASRVLNILSATVSDGRCATPPGTLWGPMRGNTVVPKPPPDGVATASSFFIYPAATITTTDAFSGYATRLAKLTEHGSYVISHEERYTPAHFQEMGRGLLIAALDMWSVNPWSRLATSACADMIRFRPGTYCNLKSLLNNTSRFGKLGPVRSGGHVPARLRQAELANMKVLRNWAKNFVGSTTTNESPETLKLRETNLSSPCTHLVSQVSAHVPITAASTTAIARRRRENQAYRQRLPACASAEVSVSGVVENQSTVTAVAMSKNELWNVTSSELTGSYVPMERRVCPIGEGNANRPLASLEKHERTKQPPPPSSMSPPQPADRCAAMIKSIRKQQVPIPHSKQKTKSIELVFSVKSKISSTGTTCSIPVARLRNGKRATKRDPVARMGRALSRSNSNEHKPRPMKHIRKRVSLPSPNHLMSRMTRSISSTAAPRQPPNGVALSSVDALEEPTFVSPRLRLRHAKRARRTKVHGKEVLPQLVDFVSPAVHLKEVLAASGK